VSGAFPRYSDEAALAARRKRSFCQWRLDWERRLDARRANLKTSPAVVNGRVFRINDDHLDSARPATGRWSVKSMAARFNPEAFK